ncbi:Hypothetical predicted protein [Mytilus galloprovincialis]|uniref:Uncharacterized protein n=1 Tax=Mytilus galloprovincialis TaxID=29158 RepID=A0A8B6GEQ9_MYTGA|nr:Hypothetical predicted protein [Mytilus galloprovincialis]
MKAVLCLCLLASIVSISGLSLKQPCNGVVFNCFVEPCAVSKCDAYPHATCTDNYCGGCHADFYVGSHKVNCTKTAPSS